MPHLIAVLLTLLPTAALSDDPLTAIGDLQRGSTVTVAGVVERITDEDEFRLADASGTVRVYVGPTWVPARVGEQVTVDGIVDDGLGPLEIYADRMIRADGTVILFDHRYD